MDKLNLNDLELKLKECNNEVEKYDSEYKNIVEMVILGDDI